MSFQLKGLLVIGVLAALIVVVMLAPWRSEEPDHMPERVFDAFEGEWHGRFTSYSIYGNWKESFQQVLTLESITADSQAGQVIILSPAGDTLALDSMYHVRRGDSLYCIRVDEDGTRELNRGFWQDGQLFWRSSDIFGRVSHAYREWVKKDIWEIDGFTRTGKGDYLLQYGRAIRR